ncbi:hypothetical protein ANN_08842 [Periplaneta americana]|uniref:Uncharacterized protein n=1 Tax=Periplaneta americana TaxID=6978 RepID=A0ABQ8T2J7_PERAM|nr:hypothetical protein ANN_08842 [Periplaneta americana]
MSPGSSTESYPAFARIGLRENPGKNLNEVTCPNRESNPVHLVSRPDALTVTPQFEVCHGSLNAVMWLVDNPRQFNLPTLPQRRITYVQEKLPSKYGVHSEEYLPIRTVTPVVAGIPHLWSNGQRIWPRNQVARVRFPVGAKLRFVIGTHCCEQRVTLDSEQPVRERDNVVAAAVDGVVLNESDGCLGLRVCEVCSYKRFNIQETLVSVCVGWMKDLVYQTKSQTREELLARIMHAATEIKDSRMQLSRATSVVHKCQRSSGHCDAIMKIALLLCQSDTVFCGGSDNREPQCHGTMALPLKQPLTGTVQHGVNQNLEHIARFIGQIAKEIEI